MSRIGFLTLYATGHLRPAIALARGLKQRGHEVSIFSIGDNVATILDSGLTSVTFGETQFPPGCLRSITNRIGELSGAESFSYFIERMALLCEATFESLAPLIRKGDYDLLIIDQLYPGGSTLAEYLDVPFISLAAALIANYDEAVPPPVLPWGYDTSAAGLARNNEGWRAVRNTFAPLLNLINIQRRKWGMSEHTDYLEDSFSPRAQISQQPQFFEFTRSKSAPLLHFVGPLRTPAYEKYIAFPWERIDGRPLVYASLGTLQNGNLSLFRTIIDACAALPVQTVVALGEGDVVPSSFGAVPENIMLVSYVPQAALLQRARLCITHGGLNTTLDCLTHGVPMVALPLASEQPGTAMRIAHFGFGTVLAPDGLTVTRLRGAVRLGLSSKRYRSATRTAAAAIEVRQSVNAAIRIVEKNLDRGALESPSLSSPAKQGIAKDHFS